MKRKKVFFIIGIVYLLFCILSLLPACSDLFEFEYEYEFKNESTADILLKIHTPFKKPPDSYSDDIFYLWSRSKDPEFFLVNPGSDSKTIYSSYDKVEFEWIPHYEEFIENYYAEINGSKVIFRDKKR